MSIRKLAVAATAVVALIFAAEPADAAPPSNDDFDSATAVTSIPFEETIDVSEATSNPDDPTTCDHSLWYSYSPLASGRIDVLAYSSPVHDTAATIAAYTGPRSDLTLAARGYLTLLQSSGSFMRLDVQAGQTYRIFVCVGLTLGQPEDHLSLWVKISTAPPAPPNDDFDDATPIEPFYDTGVLDVPAAEAIDDPYGCPAEAYGWPPPQPSIWYSYTPSEDVTVGARTLPAGGTGYNLIEVYTGLRGALAAVACSKEVDEVMTSGIEDVSFKATGGTTYYFLLGRVAYGGEPSNGGNSMEFVLGLRTKLALRTSASRIDYGDTVRLRTHLGAIPESSERTVKLYRTPIDGARKLVTASNVGGDGDFSLRVRPRRNANYIARWNADDRFWPAVSQERWVGVHARATTRLSGARGSVRRYKLYLLGDDPRQVGKVRPNHAHDPLSFIAQRKLDGRWEPYKAKTVEIGSDGDVSVTWPHPRTGDYRVRVDFAGDKENLEDRSPWRYFRIS